ncbi:MAG: AI-2E family transporter [Rickettsiaceae bacterium]|nr:AI-2E family transporter [Rickettsiaceae bacterium]
MALSINKIILGLITASFILLCCNMPGLVTTFFIALLIAYVLKPLSAKISSILHIQYFYSAVILYIIFISIWVTLIILIIPKCISQIQDLVSKFPKFRNSISNDFIPYCLDIVKYYFGETVSNSMTELVSGSEFQINHAGEAVDFIFQYASFTANIIFMTALFLIFLFFLLTDFPKIEQNYNILLSKTNSAEIRSILSEIEKLISGFLIACCNIGLIICIYYFCTLSYLGFDYSLLFAVIFGVAVIVPFLGAIIAITTCIAVSLLSHGPSMEQASILLIFSVAQIIENVLLYPKIIGDKLGIHPLAVILSALISGHFLGVIGILIAAPLAGIVKICIKRYAYNSIKN